MQVSRFLAYYVFLVLWMPMKKHVAIMFIMLFRVTVGEELQCAKKLGIQRTDMQSPSYKVQM